MSTNSFIGVSCEDGIHAVYCHWDGYPEHNGRILNDHYNDFMKTCTLINEGDISSLGPEIGEKHDFSWYMSNKPQYEEFGSKWTTFYGRDRGETGIEHKVFKTMNEFMDYVRNSSAEWAYLFENGSWITMKI